MRILVDSAMPYWQEFFVPLGEVFTFVAGEIDAQILSSIDALLVRSTTKVNQSLLQKMPKLSFVGTATAGYDHLDVCVLEQRNIKWTAAGGCNARAVAQYVTSAVLNLAYSDKFLLKDKKIAVVGYGNVGSRVFKAFKALGCDVSAYDPPLASQLSANDLAATKTFIDFNKVIKADIICLHAPFNSHCEFPSQHMFNKEVLSQLKPHQYLINAGRGELIDNQALLALFQMNSAALPQVILDVWENEPNIEPLLIPFLRYSTQHIAGHTLEGKAAGTSMLYDSLCVHIAQETRLALADFLPVYTRKLTSDLQASIDNAQVYDATEVQSIARKLANCIYDIKNDDSVFRALMAQSGDVGADFAQSRRKYPIRREFSALPVSCTNIKIIEFLRAIGFIISNGSTTPL